MTRPVPAGSSIKEDLPPHECRDVHGQRHQDPGGPRGRPEAPRACTSATRAPTGCTISSTSWWTTPSTKRWPASATSIKIILHSDGSCSVGDNGRGIPVDMHKESGKSAAEVVLTVLHAGGKFEHIGLQGVRRPARRRRVGRQRAGRVAGRRDPSRRLGLAAASTRTAAPVGDLAKVEQDDEARHEHQVQARPEDLRGDGLLVRHAVEPAARAGLPQPRPEDRHRGRARRAHAHVPLQGRHRRVRQAPATRTRRPSIRRCCYFEGKKGDIEVEVALQYNDGYQENVLSFANNINTREGGTHLTGFRAALTGTITTYAQANNYLKGFKGTLDGRRRARGPHGGRLGAAARAAVRGPDQGEARQHATSRASSSRS